MPKSHDSGKTSAVLALIVIRQRPAAYPALTARSSARRWHVRDKSVIEQFYLLKSVLLDLR